MSAALSKDASDHSTICRSRPLSEFKVQRRGSVDPRKFPEEKFELFSIPAYDAGKPDHVLGSEIGSSKKLVEPEDVLISRIVPHIQRVWIVPEGNGCRQIASGEWIIFRGADIVPEYLKHMLLAKPFHEQFMQTVAGVGGSLLRARPKEVERIEIPVPSSPEEQRRIAMILDKADEIRGKYGQALKLADELVKSAFLEMFGDPILNTKQLPTIPLGDLIKVSSGNGLTAKNMDPSGTYPVYGGNGVNGYHSEFMFEEPQLVIGRVGVYCGAVHVTKPKSWVTDNALYIREYKRPVNITYLEWALRFANLNQYAGRAAQPLISGGRIYPIEIVFPGEDEQLAFSEFVERQKVALDRLKAASDQTNDLFGSLSQLAFNGNLLEARCD